MHGQKKNKVKKNNRLTSDNWDAVENKKNKNRNFSETPQKITVRNLEEFIQEENYD